MKRLVCCALAIFVSMNRPALGFDPEEHKLVGDLGSEKAGAVFQQVFPEGSAVGKALQAHFLRQLAERPPVVAGAREWKTVRLVDPQIVKWKEFSKAKPPQVGPDGHMIAKAPLLVWAGLGDPGKRKGDDPKSGAWFTFGDLVALYGDFRRIITCDHKDENDDCLLHEEWIPEERVSRGAAVNPGACASARKKLDFTAEYIDAVRSLAQGWQFFTMGAIGQKYKTAVFWTNHDIECGRNVGKISAWSSEFMKIAKTNDWHFAGRAVKWYMGMHRQAFYLMMRAADAERKNDAPRAARFVWKALHYEGHALHSLTDLFAVGHAFVNREATSRELLAQHKQAKAPFPDWQDRIVAAPLEPVDRAERSWLDVSFKTHGILAFRAKTESGYHDAFNANGAVLKNLKQIYPESFPNPRGGIEPKGVFRGFGDTGLFTYVEGRRANPGQAEWAVAAVEDSLTSLFRGYEALKKAPAGTDLHAKAKEYEKTAALYDALGDIPIQVSNACYKSSKCFAPTRSRQAATFLWMPYAAEVAKKLGLGATITKERTVLECTGSFSCEDKEAAQPTYWTVQQETRAPGLEPRLALEPYLKAEAEAAIAAAEKPAAPSPEPAQQGCGQMFLARDLDADGAAKCLHAEVVGAPVVAAYSVRSLDGRQAAKLPEAPKTTTDPKEYFDAWYLHARDYLNQASKDPLPSAVQELDKNLTEAGEGVVPADVREAIKKYIDYIYAKLRR